MEFVVPIMWAVLLALLKFFLRTPTGTIESPVRNQKVGAVFSAGGTLSGAHRWHHIWLAVQIGNRLWPKEPEVPHTGKSWTQELVQAGKAPGEKFSLVILAVRTKHDRRIRAWLERGGRERGHPGLRRIPRSNRLDVVEGLQVAPEKELRGPAAN